MNIITPIFPCKSLEELLEFYRTLGFEVTYQQKSPNPFAIVQKGWIRLDFYGIKHHDPKKCYHTCYILTDDADDLYEEFSNALRKKSGKLPTRGLPRISEIRDKASGVREFMFSDIAGNCIRIGRMLKEQNNKEYSGEVNAANKRLSQALDFAYKSEGEPDEYDKVAKVLDKAIEREKNNHCINLYTVMITRADIAIAQGDPALAKKLLNEVKTSPLINANPVKFKTALQRAADIERLIND